MDELHYDLCVIGGGINGAGIARDAAGRGLSVLLVEAQDLAGATSSASSKLIHGGIRYLENHAFMMVHQALKEREVLYQNAPHLIRPLECVLPHGDVRPQWMLKAGLWLYDHLGGKKTLPRSRMVADDDERIRAPLQQHAHNAFIYSDCWVDDTRLVVLNAVDAAARGARVVTQTLCNSLSVKEGRWVVGLQDNYGTEKLDVTASMVVNATGPWVNKFLEVTGLGVGDPDLPVTRHVKGSHFIFEKLYEGEQAYVLQQDDGRIVFVAPYEGGYTLVGTTEEDYYGDPRDARISQDEADYLCRAVNDAFITTVKPMDAVFSFSGVRPLIDDGQANASKVTREYKIYHHKRFEAPLLSVFGGKLTTYRALSEDVVNSLMAMSGRRTRPWTAKEPLAGGDLEGVSIYEFKRKKRLEYHWIPESLLDRYVHSYGTRMDYFLFGLNNLDGLGQHFGDNVYEAEISYLRSYEWAMCVEDILWRRSKLGLHISEQTIENLEAYFSA